LTQRRGKGANRRGSQSVNQSRASANHRRAGRIEVEAVEKIIAVLFAADRRWSSVGACGEVGNGSSPRA
jgi:hypothetical protein